MDNKDLIDLQNCNAYQQTNDGNKTDWIIRKNITGEELAKFPLNVSDKLMFSIMDFAKKYELIALNAGIQFQKGRQDESLTQENIALKQNLKAATDRTEQLSNILEKHQLSGEH